MQSAYPLSRCPACKKAFRMEITRLASPPPNLGQLVCPHCGLKFQRFDPQYLKGPTHSSCCPVAPRTSTQSLLPISLGLLPAKGEVFPKASAVEGSLRTAPCLARSLCRRCFVPTLYPFRSGWHYNSTYGAVSLRARPVARHRDSTTDPLGARCPLKVYLPYHHARFGRQRGRHPRTENQRLLPGCGGGRFDARNLRPRWTEQS